MDNFHAWFKRETEAFKDSYGASVDRYYWLISRQMEAIPERTDYQATQELCQVVRNVAGCKALFQRQLDSLSKRYFSAEFPLPTISDSPVVANPIINLPNQVKPLADYSTTHQQQQQANDGFFVWPTGEGNPNMAETENTRNVSTTEQTQVDSDNGSNCDCEDCLAEQERAQEDGKSAVSTAANLR